MARTAKCRRVCAEPQARCFRPECPTEHAQTLSVEELEALRLCDLEGLEQGEAARMMEVSRGTLQRILYAARHKTACALVNGMSILIEGGHYKVNPHCCSCGKACRHCKQGDVDNE